MKRQLLAVFLFITAIFAHAADRYAPSGNSLADVVQWLAVYAACVGQYNVAYLGEYKSGDPDPGDLYWPTDIREYMAEQSRSRGNQTESPTFCGICFNYAKAAYEEVARTRNRYAGMGIKDWYIVGTHENARQIVQYDLASREQYDTIQNGVYVKINSRQNIQAHNNITYHAWLWVYANDGTIYWIDPTWTDGSGYIVWGVVRNGREEQVAPAERLCRTIPSGVSFASFSSGDAARNQGNYDQAIIDYNEAVRLDPRYAAAYNSRGLTYYKKGDYDRAIADYNQALALDPNFADAHCNRGAAYLAKRNYDQAIADCDQAIRLDPNLDAAYASRGIAYFAKGDIGRAFTDYNQAISLNPNNFRALGGRARAYLAQRNYDPALADIGKAIDLWPKDAAFYVTGAEIYHNKGEYQTAVTLYDIALKTVPSAGSIGVDRTRVNDLLDRARRRRMP
jgi:tetratricopeptide (TPR) repeat protein